MSESMIPIPIICDPGMDKDSSDYATTSYLNGQWVRFYNEKPQKIGGYRLIDWGNEEIISSLWTIERNGSVDVYMGRPSSLFKRNFTEDGPASIAVDRTPVGFSVSPLNVWDFDVVSTDAISLVDAPTEYLIAVACENNSDNLNNNVLSQVYYGEVSLNTPLQPLGTPGDIMTDGGVVVLGDTFVFLFGTNILRWSAPNDPTDFPEANTYFTAQKIVQGISIRGGGVPAGLFFSLNNLIRATFNPNGTGDADFNFDILSNNISILAPRSVLYANGEYYWVGIDHILKFNGVVEKVPNNYSTKYFYNNVNYDHKSKIHAFHNALYSEIWIFWPKFPATECDQVLILNYEKNFFFNTECHRAASQSASTSFSYPLLTDSRTSTYMGGPPPPGEIPLEVYPLWMHEFKLDEYKGSQILAINSHIESKLFCLKKLIPDAGDKMMRIEKFEPDCNLIGSMQIQFGIRTSPQDIPVYTAENKYVFNPTTGAIGIHEQGGLISVKFISNTLGGDYYLGEPTMYVTPGDDRLRF